MITEYLFSSFDILGTFVFALSGAEAAKERELDLFGIIIIAFLTACGGGIIRDVCLGVTPPVGISNLVYLNLTLLATFTVALFHRYIATMKYPVLLFDALGLSMFAIAGAQKSLFFRQNYEVSILLGVISAIGGGIIRDNLLGRIPAVLRREVYGSAALLGTCVVIVFHYYRLDSTIAAWIGISVCFCVRYFSMKKQWNLPRF